MGVPGGRPTIEVRWLRSGVAVVVLRGEHDLASATQLGQTLEDALETATHLIVDLSDAEFIDSYTMGTLIHAKRGAAVAGVVFNVAVDRDSVVAKALDIAEVLPLLARVNSVDEALASAASSSRTSSATAAPTT